MLYPGIIIDKNYGAGNKCLGIFTEGVIIISLEKINMIFIS